MTKNIKGKVYLEIDVQEIIADKALRCNVFIYLTRNDRIVCLRSTDQFFEKEELENYKKRGHANLLILDPKETPGTYQEIEADPATHNPRLPEEYHHLQMQLTDDESRQGTAAPEPVQSDADSEEDLHSDLQLNDDLGSQAKTEQTDTPQPEVEMQIADTDLEADSDSAISIAPVADPELPPLNEPEIDTDQTDAEIEFGANEQDAAESNVPADDQDDSLAMLSPDMDEPEEETKLSGGEIAPDQTEINFGKDAPLAEEPEQRFGGDNQITTDQTELKFKNTPQEKDETEQRFGGMNQIRTDQSKINLGKDQKEDEKESAFTTGGANEQDSKPRELKEKKLGEDDERPVEISKYDEANMQLSRNLSSRLAEERENLRKLQKEIASSPKEKEELEIRIKNTTEKVEQMQRTLHSLERLDEMESDEITDYSSLSPEEVEQRETIKKELLSEASVNPQKLKNAASDALEEESLQAARASLPEKMSDSALTGSGVKSLQQDLDNALGGDDAIDEEALAKSVDVKAKNRELAAEVEDTLLRININNSISKNIDELEELFALDAETPEQAEEIEQKIEKLNRTIEKERGLIRDLNSGATVDHSRIQPYRQPADEIYLIKPDKPIKDEIIRVTGKLGELKEQARTAEQNNHSVAVDSAMPVEEVSQSMSRFIDRFPKKEDLEKNLDVDRRNKEIRDSVESTQVKINVNSSIQQNYVELDKLRKLRPRNAEEADAINAKARAIEAKVREEQKLIREMNKGRPIDEYRIAPYREPFEEVYYIRPDKTGQADQGGDSTRAGSPR